MTHDAETDPRAEEGDARRVQAFLTDRGWTLSGSVALIFGGADAVLQFQVPGCAGVVGVGVLSRNGEMASLFAQAAGSDARVFYAYRGRTSGEPPRLAYLHAKIARLTAILGLPRQLDRPVVAVSQPRNCRLEAALPWSEL
jgi:hypothetical protein